VATDPGVSDESFPADRPGLRRVAALVALVLGLVGLVISATGLVIAVLPRHFSSGQQQAIVDWEVNGRWRDMPAGRIFPGTVGYSLPGSVVVDDPQLELKAVRVEIAPQTGCAAGVSDAATAQVLHRDGCEAMLRATYVDQTMSFVMTVGVAVLPTSDAATAASDGLSVTQLSAVRGARASVAGVRIVHFLGADGAMYDYSKQVTAALASGPYLVLYAAGYADGRPRVQLAHDTYSQAEITSLAQGVATTVADGLGSAPATPHCPGSPGC
jgi:hypothetical protein